MEYLEKYNRAEYIRLFLEGKLNEHLHELDEECHEQMEELVRQMMKMEEVTEEVERMDLIKWIGMVNNIKSAAEEIVVKELIYQ